MKALDGFQSRGVTESQRDRGTARGSQMMRNVVWGSRYAVDEDASREQTSLFLKKLVLYAEHTHPSFAPPKASQMPPSLT